MARNGAKSCSRTQRLAEKVFRYAVVLETPEGGVGQPVGRSGLIAL